MEVTLKLAINSLEGVLVFSSRLVCKISQNPFNEIISNFQYIVKYISSMLPGTQYFTPDSMRNSSRAHLQNVISLIPNISFSQLSRETFVFAGKYCHCSFSMLTNIRVLID